MSKKRILHVIGGLNIGGAETLLMNLLRKEPDAYDTDVLVYGEEVGDYEAEAIKLGAHVIHVGALSEVGVLNYLRQLNSVMKSAKRYDCVHAHTLFNSMFALAVAWYNKVPVRVGHAHSTQNRINPTIRVKIYEGISRLVILATANRYVACSVDAGNFMFGRTPFTKKGSVIPNGILTENFHFDSAARLEVRKRLNIDEKAKVLCHVGSFYKVKNHNFLIEVLNALTDVQPNTHLLLIGDGPERAQIQEKVNGYRLKNRVHFIGKTGSVNDYLSASDLFLFPSFFEGFGLAVVEAQYAGLRCIVSDAVPKEVDVSGGVLFLNTQDGNLWAQSVVELCKLGRVSVLSDTFTISNTLKQLKEVYVK